MGNQTNTGGSFDKFGCPEIMNKLERGPMPNVMAALPNIGGALLYHIAKFG